MSFFGKKYEFANFTQDLINNQLINQWLDKKIQKAVQQLRSSLDSDQAQFSESLPAAIAVASELREVRVEVEKIVEKTVYVDKPVYIDKSINRIVEKSVCPVWATGLEQYATLLPAIRSHAPLNKLLLGEVVQDDSLALLHWLTRSGQWSSLEQVWQILAVQVQRKDSATTKTEQQILATCVALYNQSISRGSAALLQPSVGQRYDYEQHTRVNHSGESVAAVLLAGLSNAQGKLSHSALVHTH